MMGLSFIAVIFLGAVVTASDVLDLGDSNFKSVVSDKSIILVEFFAPWCGHCKRLAPEYETAATRLLKADPPVPLAKVDCTEAGKDTCSKYGVSGYPTLKIFRNGEVSQDYDGPREANGIVSYMNKLAGPSSVLLIDDSHLQKKLDDAETNLIVGFFSEEGDLYNRFMKAADQLRSDFQFAHSLSSDINKARGHENVVVMFRPKFLHAKFEDPSYVFDNVKANTPEIVQFVRSNANGLVGQVNPDNEDSFKKPLFVAYFKVDWHKNPKGSKYWRNRVARVAKKFTDYTFAIANTGDFTRKIMDWGFEEAQEVVAVAFNEKKQVFKMVDTFSVESFQKFVEDYKTGGLKPYIKSEPVPENNNGPVKVVVGQNFDAIVNDPSKDVLIEFYAPWCGHCKTLEPKYAELGEKLKDNTDIVIAKMDATANDVPPPFEVQGFPTIYFSPMGAKNSPKKYQSGREVSDFIDYLKREATNPFDVSNSKKTEKEL